ncbi:pyroglutamyl-peptidase I family protein [Paracerasibacillus soli]|uniref:pyroglutamyl-peptidase I family protein n=1 Tax=Paracerasibacillus soli TaxID=480284 RepID=UPI00387E15F1
MIQFIKMHEPDAIISLGLAAGRKEVTVERIAINCNDGPKDNRGYEPNGEKITEAGPRWLFLNVANKGNR